MKNKAEVKSSEKKDLILLVKGKQTMVAPSNRYADDKAKERLFKQGWRIATTAEATKYFGESNVSVIPQTTPKETPKESKEAQKTEQPKQ